MQKAQMMLNEFENVNQNSKRKIMLNDSNLAGATPRYSAKRNLHRVHFFCDAPQAEQVSLAGDFNHWNPSATPMARQLDGRWMATLDLPHGYHEYVFLVDGKPVLDPNASGKTRNLLNQPVSLLAVS
jgi:1,4-alpha-glucan branching enzyme